MSGRTVFKALSAVQKEIAERGIGKGDYNEFDKYKFRGIDAVLNALAPIFAKHGVLLIPSQESCEIRTITTSNNKAMNHCKVVMDFTFYDTNGDSVTHKFPGEAMDRGDKSVNKACTAAYKYFLFEALCIPVDGTPDADGESHEVGDDRKSIHDAALERHQDSVDAIKDHISAGELEQAYEAWHEIPDQDKAALWLAPTKGGCFTTLERGIMKSNEWNDARKTYHGEQAA